MAPAPLAPDWGKTVKAELLAAITAVEAGAKQAAWPYGVEDFARKRHEAATLAATPAAQELLPRAQPRNDTMSRFPRGRACTRRPFPLGCGIVWDGMYRQAPLPFLGGPWGGTRSGRALP